MRRLSCPYCEGFNREVFRELGVCPRCGTDLLARAEARRHSVLRRDEAFIAHPTELDYATTPVDRRHAPVEHDAKDLLDYAAGLLEVTRVTVAAASEASAMVVGFLTGSADLAWLVRRRYPVAFEGRVHFVPGLRTADGESKLNEILDRAWELGRTTIVVIDEVVSGGQMRTNLSTIDRWAATRGISDKLRVKLVGMRSVEGPSDDEMRARILRQGRRSRLTLREVEVELTTVRRLLAKDTQGRPLKGVWGGGSGKYKADRIWPGGYRVRCRNRLTREGCAELDVVWSAASLDQVFGDLIWKMCGFVKDCSHTWPGSILGHGCTDCREGLARVRELARLLPSPAPIDQESVVVARRSDAGRKRAALPRLITTSQEIVRAWEHRAPARRGHKS